MKRPALEIIESYYRNRLSFRTKTPLINHIYEGLEILDALKSDEITKDAFCIHPIIQNTRSRAPTHFM